MTGIELMADERKRQIHFEGFDKSHDIKHGEGELALAAAVYAIPAHDRHKGPLSVTKVYWPFGIHWWKPDESGTIDGRIKELVKSGALIAAEIDRLSHLKSITN